MRWWWGWWFSHLVVSDSCDLVDYSPPASSVHGILQARILEWVAMPSSRESSRPRDQTQVSCITGRWFTNWAMREALMGWRACAQSVERLTPRKPQKMQNWPDQRMCSNERRKTRKAQWNNRLSVSTSIFVSGFYFSTLPRKHLRLSIKPKE